MNHTFDFKCGCKYRDGLESCAMHKAYFRTEYKGYQDYQITFTQTNGKSWAQIFIACGCVMNSMDGPEHNDTSCSLHVRKAAFKTENEPYLLLQEWYEWALKIMEGHPGSSLNCKCRFCRTEAWLDKMDGKSNTDGI